MNLHVRPLVLAVPAAIALLFFSGCGRGGPAQLEKGLSLLEARDYKAAVVHLEKATAQMPDDASAFCNLGIAQAALGNADAAVAALSRAQQLSGDGDVILLEHLGEALVQAGKWDEARRILAQANSLAPEAPRTLTAMAVVELNGSQTPETAKPFLDQALAKAPDYAPAIYNMGFYHLNVTRDREEALKYFNKYILLAGDDPHVEKARAILSENTPVVPGSTATASPPPSTIKADKADTPAPPSPRQTLDKTIELARAAVKKDEPDRALDILRNALKKAPGSADLLWEIAGLYSTHMDLPEKAAETYRIFAKQFPNDPRVRQIPATPVRERSDKMAASDAYSLGMKLKQQGDMKASRDQLAAAVKADPTMLKARLQLAIVCREIKDFPASTVQLNEIIKRDPAYADAHYLLGVISIDKGDLLDTRRRFQRYLQLVPADSQAARDVNNWLKKNPTR
jgi:tetratricopeptide (TPR) repeat protein